MPRKSNADMIAALEAKLAEAKAKEQEKKVGRTGAVIEEIKAIDAKLVTAKEAYDKAVATAKEAYDKKVARLEERRADLDAELQELAVDTVSTTQLTFSEPVEVEEV